MKKSFRYMLPALVVAGLTLSISAQAAESTPNFVKDSAIGSNFEIMSSQIALQKSSNPQIKQFAQHMIDDHSKAASQMASIVSSDNSLPQPPTTLDSKHQKMIDELNKESEPDFDKTYVKDQMKAHKETISLFDGYAKKGDNQALQSFAASTLPTLQEHENEVKQLKSSM